MALTVRVLLQRYFYLEEVKAALNDIGEPSSGSKSQLVSRLVANWESHNRDFYALLDYLDVQTLRVICKDYGLDYRGDRAALLRRIRRSNLSKLRNDGTPRVETQAPPSQSLPSVASGVSDLRRLRFRLPLLVSIGLTAILYLVLPLFGLTEVISQIVTATICFTGLWSSLRYLSERA